MIWSTDFAGPVLSGIGAELTPTTGANLWAWSSQEKTGFHPAPASFAWWQWSNPLNTTEKWIGSVDVGAQPGAHDVQAYRSIADGCAATIATLLTPIPGVLPNGYDRIVQALRNNLPAAWWDAATRAQLDTWGTGSIWCDFTPIGADLMSQLDDILAGVKATNYALLYGRGTSNADPSGYASVDLDARLDAALKPVLDAIGKLPGGTAPATSSQLGQAVTDLKAAIAAITTSLSPAQAQQLTEAHDAVIKAVAAIADVQGHVDQDLK